jgi:hypothetical protein
MGVLGRNLQKALRELTSTKKSLIERIYLSDNLDWFYNLISWFRSKKEMIGRMIYWGWHMRWSWDFDAGTIYKMLHLKLDRTYDCMKNHSHLKWNSDVNNPGMRKLCEAKHLASKLSKDNYHREYEKFSQMYKSNRKDCMSIFKDDHYPNAKIINEKLYSFMLKKAFKRDNLEKITDKRRFFMLLEKHIDSWWD